MVRVATVIPVEPGMGASDLDPAANQQPDKDQIDVVGDP